RERLSFPTRRSSDLAIVAALEDAGRPCTRSQLARAFAAGDVTCEGEVVRPGRCVEHPSTVEVRLPDSPLLVALPEAIPLTILHRSEEHTSELQSREN